ncbi:response regulator transcription factor [Lacrimispora xylanisolvens]|uniref:response regulator transcription factor n=1 Tax=Lacrimispora xylanisolvens TaxID=384636 RepID=UPI0024026955|nr:response regulator transcription factor [Paenibacillaceae bacterium]
MMKILIVEDEKAIRDLIDMQLTLAGYDCQTAEDGVIGANLIEVNSYDLILLDIMLPGVSGFELMDYIRPTKTPVIFITAKHEVSDRVKGLRLGADDYLVKPFDMVELLARVEAVLRRYHKAESVMEIEGVTIDFDAYRADKDGRKLELTAKEFGLLSLFVHNKNIALYRDMIYERVWESDFDGDSRTVDLHVQRLRKKLGWEHCLVTVFKVGYRLEVPK